MFRRREKKGKEEDLQTTAVGAAGAECARRGRCQYWHAPGPQLATLWPVSMRVRPVDNHKDEKSDAIGSCPAASAPGTVAIVSASWGELRCPAASAACCGARKCLADEFRPRSALGRAWLHWNVAPRPCYYNYPNDPRPDDQPGPQGFDFSAHLIGEGLGASTASCCCRGWPTGG